MTATTLINRLAASICTPNEGRELTSRPFACEGRTVITNGKVLVAFPGADGFDPLSKRAAVAEIPDLLNSPRGTVRVDLPAFKAWVGAFEARTIEKVEKCPECNGKGETLCVCFECDHEHWVDCDECDGTGDGYEKLGPEPLRPGRIGGAVFNRNLLAQALEHLDGESAWIAVDADRSLATLDSPDGWRVIAMGLSYLPDEKEPEAEVWPLEAAGVTP